MINRLVIGALVAVVACSPKTVTVQSDAMKVGQTYNEAKKGCPDLASQAFDRDDNTAVVLYLCPSQKTVVVGDLRTGKIVALMMTTERQNFLRDSVTSARVSNPLIPST